MSADYGKNKQFSHFELTDKTDDSQWEQKRKDERKIKTKTKEDKKKPHENMSNRILYGPRFL